MIGGEWPRRKRIRLEYHDYSQDSAYFVTVCTHDRQQLFGMGEAVFVGAHPCVRPPTGAEALTPAGKMVEKWLYKLESKYPDHYIDCYVIMPDHVHFIIVRCGTAGGHMGPPLPNVLQWFKTQTTNDYIRGVKEDTFPPFTEKVWQRSFYEHIIKDPQDMQEIRRYIYENPLKRAAEKEEEYPWNLKR